MRPDCQPRSYSPSVSSSSVAPSSSVTPAVSADINNNKSGFSSPSHPLETHLSHPNHHNLSGATVTGYPPLTLNRSSRDSRRTSKEGSNPKSSSTRSKPSKTTTPTYPSPPLVVPLSTAATSVHPSGSHTRPPVVSEWPDSHLHRPSGNSHNQLKQDRPATATTSSSTSSSTKRHHQKRHRSDNNGSSSHSHISHIKSSHKKDAKIDSSSSRSPSGEQTKPGRSVETKRSHQSSSSNLTSSASLSSTSQPHHHSRRQMGGCVTKGGAAANLIDPSALPPGSPERKTRTLDPSASTDMSLATNGVVNSPSTRPTDASNGSPTGEEPAPALKNRERRRLSLSQSDPARPDTGGDDFRGQFLINHGQASPASPGMLTQSQLEQLSQVAAAAQAGKASDDDDSDSDVDDDASLPSSDEEAARRQKEEEAHASTGGKNGSLPVPGASQQRECRRLSVSGMPSSMKQDNFENKRQEVKSDTGYFDTNTLLGLGIGYACKKGLKPESPNQDDFFIVRIDDWGLYGVFDGHGPYGHDVSNFVQRELPKLIYNDANFLSNPKEALRQSFITVHQMLEVAAATHNLFDCSLSGSTATVVLHRKTSNKLFIAHVGDSRCVLGRLSKNGRKIEAIDLTNDHKPNSEAEKKRIVASGGQVRRLEGDIPYRVFLKGRLYPGLAMSRAIGDTVGTQAGVICEPDVSEYSINSDRDLFITLCSDGVWEFLSSLDVAEVIHSNGMRGVQTSADIVARESWNRWIQEEGNVVDDITSEVIYLNPEHQINQQSPARR